MMTRMEFEAVSEITEAVNPMHALRTCQESFKFRARA